jgi:hypothetical protein
MSEHDPRKIAETLRNHLTHSETNIAFLFGAGTSCAVRVPGESGESKSLIPNVTDLTSVCAKEVKKLDGDDGEGRFSIAYSAIELEVQPKGRAANIEDILSGVRRKLEAIGEKDRLCGLEFKELEELDRSIRKTIAAQVNPHISSFPERLPHVDFVRWVAQMTRGRPVEVFTTNYDILFELAFESEREACFDGFVGCSSPFFCQETLSRPEMAPGTAWTRLWKVHGSINWKIEALADRKRVVRTRPDGEGEMIMPSHHKYDESRKQPYAALLDRLRRVMERDDTVLFTCGYSFSDEHINAILFDALEARQRPHVIALQYTDPSQEDVLSVRALKLRNLMVLGPTVANISGVRGAWVARDGQQMLGGIFQPNDAPEGEEPTGEGRFLLGDFNAFARFLASMVSGT